MSFSIEDMERRIEPLRRELNRLDTQGSPAAHVLAAALELIAELSGRLSAAEEILERRPELKR